MTDFILKYAPKGEEYEKLAQQERLILDTAERVWEQTKQIGKSHQFLADALRKGKSHISRLLGGETNMTLRTLSDLAFVLGCKVEINIWPKASYVQPSQPIVHNMAKVRARPIVTYHNTNSAKYHKAA
jgi:transcriptional regulator with XRE-family HTH domain